jgi:hypothetical protein
MSSRHPLDDLVADLKVLRLVAATEEVQITDTVATGVWAWFADVEFALPIPEMTIADKERTQLIVAICDEMADVAAQARAQHPHPESQPPATVAKLYAQLDTLWRELSGALAPVLNSSLPDPMSAEEYQRTISQFRSGFTPEEWQHQLQDPTVRMSLRRMGLDPDRLH